MSDCYLFIHSPNEVIQNLKAIIRRLHTKTEGHSLLYFGVNPTGLTYYLNKQFTFQC